MSLDKVNRQIMGEFEHAIEEIGKTRDAIIELTKSIEKIDKQNYRLQIIGVSVSVIGVVVAVVGAVVALKI